MWKLQFRVGEAQSPPRVVGAELRAEPPIRASVQSLSHVRLFATPWTAAGQVSLSITNSWSLLKLMSIELVMPSNHLILCRPLLLPPSTFLSNYGLGPWYLWVRSAASHSLVSGPHHFSLDCGVQVCLPPGWSHTVARFLFLKHWSDHVTSWLKTLRWSPISP